MVSLYPPRVLEQLSPTPVVSVMQRFGSKVTSRGPLTGGDEVNVTSVQKDWTMLPKNGYDEEYQDAEKRRTCL